MEIELKVRISKEVSIVGTNATGHSQNIKPVEAWFSGDSTTHR